MDNQQKEKEYREHCHCCGHSFCNNLNNIVNNVSYKINLFGIIMFLMFIISFGIILLFGFLCFISILFSQNNILLFLNGTIFREIFQTLLFIFGISSLSFSLISFFMPKLLFEKVDYEKVEKE